MVVCISVQSIAITTLSFFIASIWFFFRFLINLASRLSILLIFSKNQLLDLLIFWRVFHVSISFSSALILVISYLLLDFEFFWSCSSRSFSFDDRVSILDLSILLIWALICYILSSRDCFKCVPEVLACCVFVLIGFEELLYICLHFIVYPVNIQEPVVQFPWSCAVLGWFLYSEF